MRARELWGQLRRLTRRYHPPFRESMQDWLMEQMARDPVLKARVLRFIDVLAAIDPAAEDARVMDLFQEYFAGPFRR